MLKASRRKEGQQLKQGLCGHNRPATKHRANNHNRGGYGRTGPERTGEAAQQGQQDQKGGAASYGEQGRNHKAGSEQRPQLRPYYPAASGTVLCYLSMLPG